MDIDKVLAPVILAMVGLNFVRRHHGRQYLHNLAHAGFVLSKISYSAKPPVILHFSTTAVFWLWPTVCTTAAATVAVWAGPRDLCFFCGLGGRVGAKKCLRTWSMIK
jgi:hypothetical protein